MGRMQRRKGAVIEREIVNRHLELGINALRVPLSGAARGFKDDVQIELLGTCEVKARASGEGFKTLEAWLGTCDALFLRRNQADPLVLLPWSTYVRLMRAIKNADATRDTPPRRLGAGPGLPGLGESQLSDGERRAGDGKVQKLLDGKSR